MQIPARNERTFADSLNGWPWLASRAVGALAILVTGGVHLQQFDGLYSEIPTIGTLFLLNFLGATAIGLALLAPLERVGKQHGTALVVLVAAAARVAEVAARRLPRRLPGRPSRTEGAHAAMVISSLRR